MAFIGMFTANAVTIICFTILAMHFNNPWIVLLAALFFQSYKSERTINNDEKKDDNNV